MSKAINKCMIKVDSLLFNIFVYVLEEKLTHICSSQRGANRCNASVNLFRNVYWKSLEFHELLKTTFACSVLQSAICILWCRVFSLSRTAIINVHHHLHHMMRMMRHISLPRVVGMQNSGQEWGELQYRAFAFRVITPWPKTIDGMVFILKRRYLLLEFLHTVCIQSMTMIHNNTIY